MTKNSELVKPVARRFCTVVVGRSDLLVRGPFSSDALGRLGGEASDQPLCYAAIIRRRVRRIRSITPWCSGCFF